VLSRALKMAFWVAYDHLGKLLLVNLFSSALCALPLVAAACLAFALSDVAFAGALSVACVLAFLLCSCCAVALAWMVRGLIETRDGSIGAFFTGLRRFALRGAALGLCYLLIAACLLSSVWFYAARTGATHPVVGYGLSALALWALVFFGLTALAAAPAMVHKNLGPFGAIRLAAVLAIDNPLFFTGLAVQSALLACAALLMPLLLACFALAPLVVLQCAAYEMLARRYAAVDAARVAGASAPGRRGPVRVDFDDANDDYLNRGFRDLIFPWKG
jgi:hypothetical protein